MDKNAQFGEFLQTWACGQTVLPDKSTMNWTKNDGKSHDWKFEWDIFSDFSTTVLLIGILQDRSLAGPEF